MGGTPFDGLYGRLRPNGVSFSGFRYIKGRDLTTCYISKGREICHLGLLKGPKGLTDDFCGFKKSRKSSIFVTDFYLKYSAFTEVKREAKF